MDIGIVLCYMKITQRELNRLKIEKARRKLAKRLKRKK